MSSADGVSNVDDMVIETIASALGLCVIELSDRLNEIDGLGVYTQDGLRERIADLTNEVVKANGLHRR